MRLAAVLLALTLCAAARADPAREPGWYIRRAYEAIDREFYETAITLLQEGQRQHPGEPALHLILGDLFYNRQLYRPALEEYLQAERKGARNLHSLSQIARTHGRLNQESSAIRTLRRLLELYPDDLDAVDDLAWMYFKIHQLERGRQLVEDELPAHGRDRALLMTLGTIYSGLYDYPNARRLYLEAIAEAEREGDEYFTSVALYNLSLLEQSFYHFSAALRCAEEATRKADRPPSHLARGELLQGRMEFRGALEEFERALALDSTPLAKVNLAALYQRFGRLELARRYAEETLRSPSLSWMYYYGIDRDRHYRDLHEILSDVYLGLARQEGGVPAAGLLVRLGAWLRALRFRLLAYYHRQKFRACSVRVGLAYQAEGNELDAGFALYQANERYPSVALKFLGQARAIETRIAPHAAARYDLEEGRVRRSPGLLRRALEAFDPYWEREEIADALRLLAPLLPRGSRERREALARLYAINPGGLRQYGLGLPVVLRFPGEEGRRDGHGGPSAGPSHGWREGRRAAAMRRLLRRAGFELLAPGEPGARYELEVRLEDGQARFRLIDGGRGEAVIRDTVRGTAGELARGIVERVYRPD
jgi:tetratricopeptide (TPR) repeat protein